MRLESTGGDSGEVNVWLTDNDADHLRRAAASQRDDIIVQFGAYVGLRAFEVPQVEPQQVDTTDSGTYRLRVPRGKDTTGSGKPRDGYLPAQGSAIFSAFKTVRTSRRASRSST